MIDVPPSRTIFISTRTGTGACPYTKKEGNVKGLATLAVNFSPVS